MPRAFATAPIACVPLLLRCRRCVALLDEAALLIKETGSAQHCGQSGPREKKPPRPQGLRFGRGSQSGPREKKPPPSQGVHFAPSTHK